MLLKPLTKSKYNKLYPFEKGYACYMQSAWNKNIKDENPFPDLTEEYKEFNDGSFQAMLDCQDSEE